MQKILFLILLLFLTITKNIFTDEKDIHSIISEKYNVEINLNDDKFQYFLKHYPELNILKIY